MGYHRMAETITISSKPEIKCYAENKTLFDDTANTTLEKFRNLTDEEWLWTGQSVHCICTHHVEQHHTIRDPYGYVVTIYCNSRSNNNENCYCELFRPRSMKMSYQNIVLMGLSK
jgi:hypothetical protein